MKVEAPMPKGKIAKRKVTHIDIEKAANGFSINHHMEPPKTRAKGMTGMLQPYGPDPKPSVFIKHNQAVSHVKDLMSQMGGNEGEPDADDAQAQAS